MTQHILVAHSYLTNIIELFTDAVKEFRHTRANKKMIRDTIKELSALTDAELQDIGLTRGDIWYVAHNRNDNLRGWV